MIRSVRRHAPVLILVLLATLGWGQPAFDALAERYNVAEIPADYIIALDISGSMEQPLADGMPSRFAAVKEAASAFLEQVDAGAYVSLIGFGRSAFPLLVPRTMPADQNGRAGFLGEVRALPPPQTYPASSHTDLGAALAAILEELNRPQHADLQFVYVLTDGTHAPAGDSRYASPTSPGWVELTARGASRLGDRHPRVFALGLQGMTDVALIRTVFPAALITPYSPHALGAFFARSREEVRRQKVALAMARELTEATTPVVIGLSAMALPPGEEREITVPIALGQGRFDAEWQVDAATIATTLPLAVSLDPASGSIDPSNRTVSARVRVRAVGHHSLWAALTGAAPSQTSSCRLALTLTLRPTPAALMPEMDLPTELQVPVTAEISAVTIRDRVFPGEWALLMVATLLVGWVALRTWAWRGANTLYGQLLTVYAPPDAPEGSWSLRQYGREARIGGDATDAIALSELPQGACTLHVKPPPYWRTVCSIGRVRGQVYALASPGVLGLVERDGLVIPLATTPMMLQDNDDITLESWTLRWQR